MNAFLPTFEDEPRWLARSEGPSTTTSPLRIDGKQQILAEHYRDTLERAEPAHDQVPPRSGRDGTIEIDRSIDIIRLNIRSGELTRILDLVKLRREYPEIYAKYFGHLVMPGIAEGEVDRAATESETPNTEAPGVSRIVCEPAEIPPNMGELP